jgi:hypothetical protein
MTHEEAERLLRRIEVRRLFNNPAGHLTPHEMLSIHESFIYHSLSTGDWRFFNTALKLGDWLEARGLKTAEMAAAEQASFSRMRAACGLHE